MLILSVATVFSSIPVAARSKEYSNPAEGMDISPLYLLCASQVAASDQSFRGVLLTVCVCVCDA